MPVSGAEAGDARSVVEENDSPEELLMHARIAAIDVKVVTKMRIDYRAVLEWTRRRGCES
uniref:Uncharacterized protein n=1 Tax=Hyaloperonospora arabidopsidis (strain Emoy2) TaxID=559515 RepID=M4C4C7_HYAAE